MAEPGHEVLEIAMADGVLSGLVRIPGTSPFFDGHFPGSPLLPGVAQAHLAVRLVADALGSPVRVRSLRRVKFSSPVRPGAILAFRIEADPGQGRIAWKFTDTRSEVSTGELSVAMDAP